MNVLHVGKYFPPHPGGMETYLRDLLHALSSRDIDAAALVHRSTNGLRSHTGTEADSGRPVRITRCAVWFTLLFTPVSPAFPLHLNRLLREMQPDLLHLHLPNVSAFWALLLPRARRIPWVIHWHSDVLPSRHSPGLRLFYRLYRPFEQALLKRAATVVATSPPYLETSAPLRRWRDKCTVVPLGLDPRRLPGNTTDPPHRGNDDALRILVAGRVSYYKGIDHLLRALPDVPDAMLAIAGDGAERERLQRLAGELGLADRVVFHGQVSDAELAALYDACDCLCLPSIERTEAFGLVLLEAMSRGRAVVISDVPGSGMGWVVEDGRTGRKVPPANSAALADSLRQMAADGDTIFAMGVNGREAFHQRFHITRSADSLIPVYQSTLKGWKHRYNRK